MLAPVCIPVPSSYTSQYNSIEYCIRAQQLVSKKEANFDMLNYVATSVFNGIKNKISEISDLRADWDGYGASAPSTRVVTNSFKFLDSVLNKKTVPLKSQDITPTPYGTIVFDFRSDRGLVSVEIGSEELGYFTDFDEGQNYMSDGIETNFRSIPSELESILATL